MNSIRRFSGYCLAALASVLTSSAASPSSSPAAARSAEDFVGAFVVQPVATVDIEQLTVDVDAVGTGCVTHEVRATCANYGAERLSLIDLSGTATYTIYTPGGSFRLALVATAEDGGYDPVLGKARFGGTFTLVPGSGTGEYKKATGSGVWSGTAEGALNPGKNPPGQGRWAFWGTIVRAHKCGK